MSERIGWGIIGTGRIAGVFARALPASRTGYLAAVGSRARATAERFAEEHRCRPHGSYEELLADHEVRAVYIATPHPMHAEWAIKAAQAGKNILCEKPLTMDHAEAAAVVEAARQHNVFLMEAFMYRCHPQTRFIAQLIRNGMIGQVRAINAGFSFASAFNAEGRVDSPRLGGGGILDVGCYCMSMARLIAGAALDRDFAEPLRVTGVAARSATGVDEQASASLLFEGGITATLSCGVRVALENRVRIYGTGGGLEVQEPWSPSREGGRSRILLHRSGATSPELIEINCAQPLYAVEADRVGESLPERQAPWPCMSWEDSLGNMAALDRWQAECGRKADGCG